MTTGILTVTKVSEGQEWANTYGISVGDSTGPLNLADLVAITDTNPAAGFTSANTEPANAAFAGGTSIIAAILGFERLIHYHTVFITRLNLSDSSTPGTATGPFWSGSVNLQCIKDAAAFVDDDAIAPLNCALLVNRNSGLPSVRPGRLYYRAAMLDATVKPGSKVGITWRNTSDANVYSTFILDSQGNSNLDNYMSTSIGPLPPIFLSIPHMTPGGGDDAVIVSAAAVSTLNVNKPVSRQLTRGRRRRVVAI